jgi:hypothetical protein
MLPEQGVAERTVRSRRRSTTRSIVTSCDEVPIVAQMFEVRQSVGDLAGTIGP